MPKSQAIALWCVCVCEGDTQVSAQSCKLHSTGGRGAHGCESQTVAAVAAAEICSRGSDALCDHLSRIRNTTTSEMQGGQAWSSWRSLCSTCTRKTGRKGTAHLRSFVSAHALDHPGVECSTTPSTQLSEEQRQLRQLCCHDLHPIESDGPWIRSHDWVALGPHNDSRPA